MMPPTQSANEEIAVKYSTNWSGGDFPLRPHIDQQRVRATVTEQDDNEVGDTESSCTFQPMGNKNSYSLPDSVHKYLCFQLFANALTFCHLFCKPKEHFLCSFANVGKVSVPLSVYQLIGRAGVRVA